MSAYCDGKIRRYGEEYVCGQKAAYAVRADAVVVGTCRQHLAQVVDDIVVRTEAVIAEVIPIIKSS